MTLARLAGALHRHPLLLAALVLWSLVWKGLALWRAARAEQPVWFVALLVVNTAGLLEIAYLFFFAPRPQRFGVLSR
jgi:hypothetical protein